MGTSRIWLRTGLATAAGLILLVAASVALAASGTFTGTTSQGNVCQKNFKSPCAVRVQIAHGEVGKPNTGNSYVLWRAACRSGKFLTGTTEFWGRLKDHNLTVHGTYTERGLGRSPKGQVTAKDTVTVTLHAAAKVTGTLKDSSVVYEGSTVADHCHTGTVDFTARR
jgi:hypothetical protein